MIAAALITEPKLLIADEPTTALDVTIQSQILKLLKKINERHHTAILFISHDLGVIRSLCDRVIVMNHGTIVESGSVDDVFFTRRKTTPAACSMQSRTDEHAAKANQNRFNNSMADRL